MPRNLHRLFSLLVIQKQIDYKSVRLYSARWMKRNPSKVLLPFEPSSQSNLKKENIINLDAEIIDKTKDVRDTKNSSPRIEPIKSFTPEKTKQIIAKRNEILKKRTFYLSKKTVFDDNNEIIYEKLKENDSRISSLLVKLKSKKDRIRLGQVLVEGWRLIMDGLESGCKLKYVIFSQKDDLDKLRPYLPKTGVLLYKIPYKEIELWSDVDTSPGIFGIFEMPTTENIRRIIKPLPLNFICDNIRVPGNLGAILRVAVGVGCERVLLSKGCVDLWDSKVIRSAAGAHFRMPIHTSIEQEDLPKLLDENTTVLIADSNAKVFINDEEVEFEDDLQQMQLPVVPYYGADFTAFKHITLVIGGETEGISDESYQLAASKNGLRLNIPLQKGVDSLNTGMATAVIAFEIRKQFQLARHRETLNVQNNHAL
ncbi:hypothetical protein ACJJTC_001428 [Scirpophaga incertulas]